MAATMSLTRLPLRQSPASLSSSQCRLSRALPNPASSVSVRFGPTRHVGIRASAEPEPSQASDTTPAAADKTAAGKGFGKAPQPAVVRRAAPTQPLLSTKPMGEEEKQAAEIETAVVVSLGFAFLLIILEGLFLAAAGFLSEDLDQFAMDVVYPAFSPTVAVFLLGATAYGTFKVVGIGKKE
ncbi:hypothetical protein CLOM_g7262 [Closterium sp. NIES-68]|nr:hypothetical protein CLOM_g7262 [Closterium sp. NIES-68]GJP75962.1 hypothetical protein CLOP_g6360 [Closterium sp. NIES-67]